MRRTLLTLFMWLVLGASIAFLLNWQKVSLLDADFHPSANWFLVGLGYLLIGVFRCMPSGASREFSGQYLLDSDQRRKQFEQDEARFARAIPGGLLMLATGVLILLYASFFL